MDTPSQSPSSLDLAEFLAKQDASCPVCNYNLRGLLNDRCPECGRHLVLTVGTTEPKLGAFILGLIGLSSGLGFCGLLLGYALLWFFGRGGGPPMWDLVKLLIGVVVCGLGLVGWLATRHHFGRKPDHLRWFWAAGCVLVGLLCPVWFILTVR
jgi:hypothetical protein